MNMRTMLSVEEEVEEEAVVTSEYTNKKSIPKRETKIFPFFDAISNVKFTCVNKVKYQ